MESPLQSPFAIQMKSSFLLNLRQNWKQLVLAELLSSTRDQDLMPFRPRMLWVLAIAVITALFGSFNMPLLAVACCLWPVRRIGSSLGVAGPIFCGLAALAGFLLPWITYLVVKSPVHLAQDAAGAVIVFAFARLSRRESRAVERARIAAGTDTLTGLINRKGFLDRLLAETERSQRHKTSLAIAYLDCDTFKQYNDTHGHLAGDQFLIQAASIMRGAVRPYDSIGRLGGDEFAVLYPAVDAEEAEQLAIELRDALAAQNRQPEHQITWTCGLAVFSAARKAEEMLDHADKLMLAGKRSSRGGVRIQVFHGGLFSHPAPPVQR
ncbi:GGDEF domain-containing protein [Planctomicrobium sp. SH664]|uniref:GGDEF domain-containing protein n=1 Tax=Planctomicrobium sp. SH664 TaxID=3448125 RepID=UPI003F5C97A8